MSGKRRISIAVILLVCGAGLAAGAPTETMPTSVLLVTLDTTRADHLGCYGAQFSATPNLDALAKGGTRFERALSPTPLTLPSHASLLTGLVPRRHGVRSNAPFRLGSSPTVLAERLQAGGYDTAGFVSAAVLDRVTGIDRGFDYFDDSVRIGSRRAFNYIERAAVQTNEAVLDRLDSLEAPFFLWVHYFDPHLPYVPPAPFRERFPDRPYVGEIAFMDQQLGELLAEVRRKTDSLLVVAAGDHGESLGEHGEAAHGLFVYQATQRVPLIVAGPGVPAGRVVSDTVGLIDVAPTILDLLEFEPLNEIDGRSLVPVVRGSVSKAGDYELESLFPQLSYGWAPVRGLVRGDLKFIDAPTAELYRLSDDPSELNDLVGTEKRNAAKLARALRRLEPERDHEHGDEVASVDLEDHRRRLESIGYVAGTSDVSRSGDVDPKDGVEWLVDLEAGRRALQAGEPAKGVAALRRLLARNPENAPALLALSQCYLATGDFARAIPAARRALELRPRDSLVHFNLANALAGNPELTAEARKQFNRALELNPRFADAYLNFASFLSTHGADAEALSTLGQARDQGVADPDIENRIALLELKRGDLPAAVRALKSSLKLRPRDPATLKALARIEKEALR